MTMLGSLVLVAWHLGIPSLIRILPNDSVVAYNTALCFLWMGAGLYAVAAKRPWLTTVSGVLVLVLSSLTLGEYLFGLDLGIDQALMRDDIEAYVMFPGRMALATTIAFLLSSLGLLWMNRDALGTAVSPRRAGVVALTGTVVVVLGVMTILLFLTGMQVSYGWGKLDRSMAMPTAVGFVMLGVGLVSWSWQQSRVVRASEIYGLPFVVVAGGLTVTLLLWQALVVQAHRGLETIIASTVAHVESEIRARMEARMLTLARMAARQERWAALSQEDWIADAESIMRDFPGFQAIAWIDSTLHVRWIAPLDGNEALVGREITAEPQRRTLFETVRETRAAAVSGTINLVQGGRGFVMYLPISGGGNFAGVVSGGFHAEVLFAAILQEIAPGYALVVMNAHEELYQRVSAGEDLEAEWGQTTKIEFAGTQWQVRVWPLPTTLARQHSRVTNWALGLGLLVTALFSIVVALAQERHVRARTMELTSQELFRENARRQEAETAVRTLNMELDRRVREQTAALTRANDDLRQLAYVSAHDLQEPVRMVSTYTQLLARRYQGQLDEEADRIISQTVAGTTRMQSLLTDVLAYLQLNIGEHDRSAVSCEEILATVLSDLHPEITATSAVITHDPLPTVQGSGRHLALVFRHLIENALTFCQAASPRVHVWAQQRGETWVVAVRDHGIGIEPRYAERIFLMFERLHPQADYPGTGMGLTLCKKIVERHGGEMWVESQFGEGATFYFTIPLLSMSRIALG
ncbi:MAG: hypothetical protein HOP18_03200 [Deltaproteobacteria bacterium]|nr:hypothetical protein [Deltaproteobacteria bacterium]